jgi:queuine tRNA-ribosyltransferase
LKNARFADDAAPLDPDCDCPACRQFTRAYLHHTVKSGEIIAAMLLTWHNLTHYQRLIHDMREAISQSRVSDWAAQHLASRETVIPEN